MVEVWSATATVGPVSDLSAFIKAYDVRGLVPEQLSTTVATAIGAAFADVIVIPDHSDEDGRTRPTAAIGHDMRPSSPGLVDAFARGLTQRGVDVILVGLCSTDGLYFASGHWDIPGAMFTASHNPAQYNGIKMCRARARAIGQDSGLRDVRARAEHYLDNGIPLAEREGTMRQHDVLAEYGEFLRSLVDLSAVRPLRVVVDAGNGMAGLTAPAVLGTAAGLAALPLEIIPLFFELDGTFPHHEANPLDPANLRDIQKAVVQHQADVGLAFDGDADRCFIIDEQGRAVNPSAIAALVGLREVARERAEGRSSTVMYNLICSQAVPELVTAAGATAVRTRVGHSFIKAQMAQHDAIFGGEHSGHFYFRDFFFADTGMLTAMHVLAALGEQPHPLSDLIDQYTPYAASGEINSTVTDMDGVFSHVERAVTTDWGGNTLQIDHLDGLTVSAWNDPAAKWWFNVRSSNTEPLVRLNVEATDEDLMQKVRDDVLALIREGGRHDDDSDRGVVGA